MQFDRGYISPYFITNADKMRVEMEDPYILIYEKKLSGLQELPPTSCSASTVSGSGGRLPLKSLPLYLLGPGRSPGRHFLRPWHH
jgi:hypothetical protein